MTKKFRKCLRKYISLLITYLLHAEWRDVTAN